MTVSGCGCHGGDDAPTGAPFARPRFFAGQLLTEDDLEALSGYVTGKNRLHNRYLFGAGVVCGLQVGCHPCGGGTVRVAPGYALDCCGNDIVVECAEELDVNKLVRDLRARNLGQDCGDPCAPASKSGNAEPEGPTRHYCLYVRYTERPVEPVAPYATEEPCGHQACEPTRIREGHTFLLRCREPEAPVDDLLGRLAACLPGQTDSSAAVLIQLARYGSALVSGAAAGDAAVAFDGEADSERLVTRLDTLAASITGLAPTEQPQGDGARLMADDVRALAATLARWDLQDDATRDQLRKDHPDLARVDDAREAVADAAARLRDVVESTWAERIDREIVTATLDQATRVGAGETADLERAELVMLAQGLPWSGAAQAAAADGAAALKEWLLDRLDAADWLTDCELREIVQGITLPSSADPQLRAPALAGAGSGARALVDALRRYLVACVCSALNPPCRPCVDQDVLLACVEVRDCEVVRVCNTERQFVVSGSALRYWLPLERLGRLVEQWCCAPPERPRKQQSVKPGEPVVLAVAPELFTLEPPELPRQVLGPLAALGLSLPDQLGATSGLITELTRRVEMLEASP